MAKGKLKMLHLIRIFSQETDDDHALTLQEIITKLAEAGLCLSGLSPDGRLVETVEIPGEAFFVGVQFHPEFRSRPNKPHPLFMGFVGAALKKL